MGDTLMLDVVQRWHMQHSYPAIKAAIKEVENRDPEKKPFPDMTEETFLELPWGMAAELLEAIYELNPHWSPFFARVKAMQSG